MEKWRKKPSVVDVVKVEKCRGFVRNIPGWLYDTIQVGGASLDMNDDGFVLGVFVTTPEGEMVARVGDYVIRDDAGKVSACSRKSFESTYQPASEPIEIHVFHNMIRYLAKGEAPRIKESTCFSQDVVLVPVEGPMDQVPYIPRTRYPTSNTTPRRLCRDPIE